MFSSRFGVGGVILLIVLIALAGSLAAQTPEQNAKPAEAQETTLDIAPPGEPAGQGAEPDDPVAKGRQQPPTVKSKGDTGADPDPNQPVPGAGWRAFIDPATGEIVEPTEAQLLELDQKVQQATGAAVPVELVERAGVAGGMVIDVPPSLHPVVQATVGPDGQVAVRHASPDEAQAEAMRIHGPELPVGPGGDLGLELPPPAEVTVTIVNNDGAGEGFNDPTPVAAVFGNPGTTLGAQRLNVFMAAGKFWGSVLKSAIPIRVGSEMNALTCDAGSAVLGSAGPNTAHRNFPNRPVADTWYVQAVANSLAGADQDARDDIFAQFNSSVDFNDACLAGTNWWYGIGAPAPAGTVDFYTVVLHELGHGIGVLTLVTLSTGVEAAGFDDAYERYLWDMTTGMGWSGMSDAQRVNSAVNSGNVVFIGPRSRDAARGFLTSGLNSDYPRIFAPNPVQGGSSISHFDTALSPNELMEPSITAPPGPYAYLTSGLLQDVGWRLLTNGGFDFRFLGTWTWNPTTGWAKISDLNPVDLEPWNGNIVGDYGASGTWVWNGTTAAWSLISNADPENLTSCGDNLLWENTDGTWRWNGASWLLLSSLDPDYIHCFGGNMAWESVAGTWIYKFSPAGWTKISDFDPTFMLPCGSNLVWWATFGGAAGTWVYNFSGAWTRISDFAPDSVDCWRGQVAWASAIGTWLYNFSTGWTKISDLTPQSMVAWGPTLAWESAAGTWTYSAAGAWAKISDLNPSRLAALGADLIWVSAGAAGTWVYRGPGATAGSGWLKISDFTSDQVVSTGVVP